MPLQLGARLGAYEILVLIGAGGMGEVYRARDTKLNRDVALKVLPEAFAVDGDRLARFRREAQVLASLNHPNIGAIYGFEEAPSTSSGQAVQFLVLELIEGETLAERLKAHGSGLRLEEVLTIARQVAEACQAAHEKGIVHRDLKPANIAFTADDQVKVLDFGLAKALAPSAPADVTNSPTISLAATRAGVILGTAAYMSPEQAKGRDADKRSDVWAFGAVLYEMLTGKRPFEGEDLSDTLANVLKSEPDWRVLPADLPASIRTLVKRCLDKDRKQRIADISTALFVMNEPAILPSATASAGSGQARQPFWRRAMVPVAALVVGCLATGGVWFAMRSTPAAPHVTRFTFAPTGPAAIAVDAVSRELAIAPDGTSIVYVAGGGVGGTQLFVRKLDRLEPTPLVAPGGTPRAPFFKPDGQWVGFADPGTGLMKKVAITGGPAQTVCKFSGQTRGFTWSEDDQIIFATSDLDTGLQRVSAGGGEPTSLTKPRPERGESDHLWPQLLPGGEAVLFTITSLTGGIDAAQVALLDLRTGAQEILIPGGSQAHYVSTGHLVYAAAGALRAVAFDLKRRQVVGDTAISVVPEVSATVNGTAKFDVSGDGTLVYLPDTGIAGLRALTWVDRQGREDPIKVAPRLYTYPRISPDGTRVALDIRDQDQDIWTLSLADNSLTRLTLDSGFDRSPVWTLDGQRILFGSQAGGGLGNIFSQAADGTGAPLRLTPPVSNARLPSSMSLDGTRLVFTESAESYDVMMVRLDKDNRVEPLLRTSAGERNGEVSPNGRWLVYESDDSGQYQIFVRPFPDVNAGKWTVSAAGGTRPLWAKSGRELFYVAPSGAMMAVRVETGSTWATGETTKLFEGPYYFNPGNTGRTYDFDGKRFLMIKPLGSDQRTAPASLIVVENWTEELKRLVPITR